VACTCPPFYCRSKTRYAFGSLTPSCASAAATSWSVNAFCTYSSKAGTFQYPPRKRLVEIDASLAKSPPASHRQRRRIVERAPPRPAASVPPRVRARPPASDLFDHPRDNLLPGPSTSLPERPLAALTPQHGPQPRAQRPTGATGWPSAKVDDRPSSPHHLVAVPREGRTRGGQPS
jgi:hypothetical protein